MERGFAGRRKNVLLEQGPIPVIGSGRSTGKYLELREGPCVSLVGGRGQPSNHFWSDAQREGPSRGSYLVHIPGTESVQLILTQRCGYSTTQRDCPGAG